MTSNPTIFDHAIEHSDRYDDDIRKGVDQGLSAESVFFQLSLADLSAAAELFAPAHRASDGMDGWVSLEVSPRLAHDAASTAAEAKVLHSRAGVDNLFIKIPGTEEGAAAIENCIAAGIPINVTLLFSPEHYQRAADTYLRGLERRTHADQDPVVGSVASLFVSRWDAAVADQVDANLHDRLGIAVATKTYQCYRELLAAPDTINTMPETTLQAFADHGTVGDLLPTDGGDADEVLAEFDHAGVDVAALAAKLQSAGEQSFDKSWDSLLTAVERNIDRLGGS